MRERQPSSAPSSLLRSTAGAAYLEFLIAFLPLIILFLGTWQVAQLLVAHLIVQHAAIVAARAAAVIVAEPAPAGSTPHAMTPAKRATVTDAAYIAAAPMLLNGWITGLWVTFPKRAGEAAEADTYDPGGDHQPSTVRVRVTAEFACTIAPVHILVCGVLQQGGGPTPESPHRLSSMALVAEATYPYQGARYRYAAEDLPQ